MQIAKAVLPGEAESQEDQQKGREIELLLQQLLRRTAWHPTAAYQWAAS